MVPAALPWRLIRFRVGKHCELRYQSPNATTNEERGRRCGPSAPRIPVLAAWECESVTLIAIFEQCAPPGIAGNKRGDMRLEQVVQPSRPGSFFKGHKQASAQPLNELQNRCRFGLDDRLHYQLATPFGRVRD